MKRLLFSFVFMLLVASAAMAAPKQAPKIFTETIKNTDVKTVQETVYKIFTDAGFSPVGIFPDRVVIQKQFGDGYMFAGYISRTTFITLQKNDDVIMTAIQSSTIDGITPRKTSITYLVPMIKLAKEKIDGTPISQIEDETQDVTDLKSGKKLGLTLCDKNSDGQYPVIINDLNPMVKKSGLMTGDIITEVDFKLLSDMDKQEAEKYINDKWEGCTYLIMQIIHNGKQNIIKLRKDQVL